MTPIHLAQQNNLFSTGRRDHWQSDENTAYLPIPQPPVQSTQSDYRIVYSWDDYADLSTREMPTSSVNKDMQTQFMKIWKQADNFTGEMHDLLDDRTRHFLSVCDSIGVTTTQYAPLFRLILTGRAQKFYLINI